MLRSRARGAVSVYYTISADPTNGHAYLVEFEPKPSAGDGEIVHLTLEDGRVIQCQVLDESPYCAVVGDGPVIERRNRIRDGSTEMEPNQE